MSDELVFSGEPTPPHGDGDPPEPWKILVVDDEEDVHRVTRLVLSGLHFHGASLEILDAYSGEEAVAIMREHPDVAVVLLDIVMETEQAGWDVVKRVRQELGNHAVRIIVRTGYHGTMAEDRIINEFEINDYRGKGELTRERLFVAISSALQSFQGVMALNNAHDVLERLRRLVATVSGCETMEEVARQQLCDFAEALQLSHALVVCERPNGAPAQGDCRHNPVAVGIGRFAHVDNAAPQFGLTDDVYQRLEPGLTADVAERSGNSSFVVSRTSAGGLRVAFYLASEVSMSVLEAHAIEWFVASMASALGVHLAANKISGEVDGLISSLNEAAEAGRKL